MNLRVLYMTRKFPPMKGGMEETNFQLSRHLGQYVDVDLISWGGSQRWLPVIFIIFFFRAACALIDRRIHLIHTGDALLSPLTRLLKILFKTPVTATVYGLDITWELPLYQPIIVRCLNGLDQIVCISGETRRACLLAGIEAGKLVEIPPGIDPTRFRGIPLRRESREVLGRRYGIPLMNRAILLSVGRFIRRKGFQWFIEEVLPRLVESYKDVLYVLVGMGPLRTAIQEAILAKGLDNHCLVVEDADDALLRELYGSADVFVMPNIPVQGDMEGFGIVALEAASSGLPVVASRLEGITDAITEAKNGILVEPLDSDSFLNAILWLLSDEEERHALGRRAREFTMEVYAWNKIVGKYYELFSSLSQA